MNIGTLTFHITSNYGALLQAYALQQILNRMGHFSEIIDYRFPGSEDMLCTSFLECRTLKRKYQYIKDLIWGITGPVGYGKRLRTLRTIDFINCYLPISEKQFNYYKELLENASHYDAYVVGSDQVWNPDLLATSGATYLLGFVPESILKISYAASFGVSSLTPEQTQFYGTNLQRFDFISVREQDGVQLVNKTTCGKNAQLVLDPTMLLLKDEWLGLAAPNYNYKDYILCYFLDEFEPSRNFVYDLQKYYKLPIYYVGFTKKEYFNSRIKIISDAGPREFIALFANATHIVTNSFHGCVFSLIFNKNFHCFFGTGAMRKSMNSRLYTLANFFNLNDRICKVEEATINPKPINYEEIELLMEQERKNSMAFLNKSLNRSSCFQR